MMKLYGKVTDIVPELMKLDMNKTYQVEIKEPKDNQNQHPKIQAVDKVKERLKDDLMKTNANTFNYLKIVEKENSKFLKYLELAKERFVNNDTRPIVMI